MITNERLIFLHGSDSSSQTYKARLLRRHFPEMETPDFSGTLEERMLQLESIIGDSAGWTLIGSSLGGLMAPLFASSHPAQVRKLVLLAPALTWPGFSAETIGKISLPCTIIHGTLDEVVPLEEARIVAEKVFTNLTYLVVKDDHRLHKTAEELDWGKLLH
jgi:pimeloyl-ACP methyl ester carboxylesterase